MKKIILLLLLTLIITVILWPKKELSLQDNLRLWEFQAVDTMKYSRDVSREKLNDPSFDITINNQIKNISAMGATHVGIATPYDEEFIPILKRWVNTARRHNLKIWYRGNWSGWEGWFGYPKIDRATHIVKSREFILNHPELFKDGDVFSACPECENGGSGDPRLTRDVKEYRQFLIDENTAMKSAFKQLGKNVNINYNSMNGDVARLVMDRETTKALGGVVVIDHYVRTPDQLAKDIQDIADTSGGKVVLGEFGAPILDINGQMTEDEQAQWLSQTMEKLISVRSLTGMSYWVNVGGSTSLFNEDGTARKAVSVLSSFYNPVLRKVQVVDPLGGAINTTISLDTLNRHYSGTDGGVMVPVIMEKQPVIISANGFGTKYLALQKDSSSYTIVLDPTSENLLYKFRKFFRVLIRI